MYIYIISIFIYVVCAYVCMLVYICVFIFGALCRNVKDVKDMYGEHQI